MLFSTAQGSAQVRPAKEADRLQLSNLFYFESFVHRHLDWKQPLDWLGEEPFFVLERKGRIIAALACPSDLSGVAWVKAFVTANTFRPEKSWTLLWPYIVDYFSTHYQNVTIAALGTNPWMGKLLETQGFFQTCKVTVLAWSKSTLPLPPRRWIEIRLMQAGDLPAVCQLDNASFEPLWQNSLDTLTLAFQQAVIATVVEVQGQIIGYQISTPAPQGGHLARLAVEKDQQGKGIGYALVYDLLERFKSQGAMQVTVNTQTNNHQSLAIYHKAQFQPTGQMYPVYQYG